MTLVLITTQDNVDRLATRTVTGNDTKVISLFANESQCLGEKCSPLAPKKLWLALRARGGNEASMLQLLIAPC